MTRTRAAIAALACSLALICHAGARGAPLSYDGALLAAAQRIERAAKANGAVPSVHVPPAPLGGPPRFSPSLDDWLQRVLAAARHDKPKRRADDLRAIAASLRYVATGSKATAGAPEIDIGPTVRSILAQPAYHVAKTTPAKEPQPSLFDRILQWIFDKIGELFERLASVTQGAPILGTVLAYAILAAAIVALAFVAYRVARRFTARRTPMGGGIGDPLPPEANADELFGFALSLARAGHAAQAIALAYQAALVLLDRSDRVTYDASRTAGEYRRLVSRKAPAVASFFDSLARIFTVAAFAEKRLGDDDWQRAASAFSDMRRTIAARDAV